MVPIYKSLQLLGPCLSSKLAAVLVEQRGISHENARKLISRSVQTGEIRSIKNVFPKRENFLYLKESYGSDSFWKNLTKDLVDSGSAVGLALTALAARGGIIPLAHFGAASGSPLAMKKKLSFNQVQEKLLALGLCKKISLAGIGDCLAITERDERRFEIVLRQVNSRLVTEAVFISAIKQWAQNLSLVSYDSVKTRLDNTPAISSYQFDISAPSYLSPLVTMKNESKKPGFFACDVLLGTTVTLIEVQPFINKCKALLSLKNIGKTIFIFAASHFEKEALIELKKHGIIPATPENLFGEEVAKSLQELNDFLRYYFVNKPDNIEKIDSLMSSLAQVKGASAQLQGALFEFLVAEVVREDGGNVEIGRLCKSQNGKLADSDVCVTKRYKEVRFIECKGYKPYSTVKHEDVKNWISKQIPVFRDQGKTDYPKAEIKVELWTTGKFADDSLSIINRCKTDNDIHKRCEIHVLEAHDVRAEFYNTKNKNLINVYEKHFADTYYKENNKKIPDKSHRIASGPDDIFLDE